MELKKTNSIETAALKTGFSRATGYRINQDPRLPSQKYKLPRGRPPDPLAGIFHEEVVPVAGELPEPACGRRVSGIDASPSRIEARRQTYPGATH